MSRTLVILGVVGGIAVGFTLRSVTSPSEGSARATGSSRNSAIGAAILERLKSIEMRLDERSGRVPNGSPHVESGSTVEAPGDSARGAPKASLHGRKNLALERLEKKIANWETVVNSPEPLSDDGKFARSLTRIDLEKAIEVRRKIALAENDRELHEAIKGLGTRAVVSDG